MTQRRLPPGIFPSWLKNWATMTMRMLKNNLQKLNGGERETPSMSGSLLVACQASSNPQSQWQEVRRNCDWRLQHQCLQVDHEVEVLHGDRWPQDLHPAQVYLDLLNRQTQVFKLHLIGPSWFMSRIFQKLQTPKMHKTWCTTLRSKCLLQYRTCSQGFERLFRGSTEEKSSRNF